MPENNPVGALIPAVIWSVLTAVMAAGIVWALPDVAPLPMLLFGVCLVSAIIWWSTFARVRKQKKKKEEK